MYGTDDESIHKNNNNNNNDGTMRSGIMEGRFRFIITSNGNASQKKKRKYFGGKILNQRTLNAGTQGEAVNFFDCD